MVKNTSYMFCSQHTATSSYRIYHTWVSSMSWVLGFNLLLAAFSDPGSRKKKLKPIFQELWCIPAWTSGCIYSNEVPRICHWAIIVNHQIWSLVLLRIPGYLFTLQQLGIWLRDQYGSSCSAAPQAGGVHLEPMFDLNLNLIPGWYHHPCLKK